MLHSLVLVIMLVLQQLQLVGFALSPFLNDYELSISICLYHIFHKVDFLHPMMAICSLICCFCYVCLKTSHSFVHIGLLFLQELLYMINLYQQLFVKSYDFVHQPIYETLQFTIFYYFRTFVNWNSFSLFHIWNSYFTLRNHCSSFSFQMFMLHS